MDFRDYISQKKVNLGYIADRFMLPSVGGLDKYELIDRIVTAFLSPENLRRWLSVLDDQTFELWEKGAKAPVSYKGNSEDSKRAGVLADMHLAYIEYAPYEDLLWLTSFEDVWQAYEESISGEEFAVTRKKTSWMWKCLGWANDMYVYTPKTVFLELVNVNKEIQISAEELDEMIKPVPPLANKAEVLDEALVRSCYFGDEVEDIKKAIVKQGIKGFYIPTFEELEEYAGTEAIISKKPYRDLRSFLMDEKGVSEENAELTIKDLWGSTSYGWGNMAIGDLLMSIEYDPDDEETIKRLIESYRETCKVTNSRFHRGYTAGDILSGNYKTIPAPLSIPDEYFAAEEIPRTKWVINDDGSICVLGGRTYANDPCPCGSGLKYKQCCGNPKNRTFGSTFVSIE